MIEADQVEEYLKELPWLWSRLPESESWLIVLENDKGKFHLTVDLESEWVVFQINPLIEDITKEAIARLAFHLCRLNQDIICARFAIDEELDISLTLELMRNGLVEDNFYQAINTLDYYLEMNFEELVKISHNSMAHSQYLADPNEN